MRRLSCALVFLVLAVLAFPVLHADSGVSELSYRTIVSPVFANGENITVKIIYINFSYYNKQDIDKLQNGIAGPTLPKDASQDKTNLSSRPLNGSQLFFTLDDANVSSDGASVSCNPAISGENGEAKCTASYYQNSSDGYGRISDRRACGMLQVEFRGMWRGPVYYQPSSLSFPLCPASNKALSAFGPALFSALGLRDNMAVCFPALLIIGLLISSMYYSGRDPLSLFDLTTPRLPKGKPARISGGGTAMGIRSAVTRYKQAKRLAMRDTEKLLMKVAGQQQGWGRRKEAKKEIRKLFKDIEKDLNDMRRGYSVENGQKVARTFNANTIDGYHAALAKIFEKYGGGNLKSKGEYERKMYDRYMQLSSALVNLYTFSEHGMRQQTLARAPIKGRWYGRVSTMLNWADSKTGAMEDKVQRIWGYNKWAKYSPLALLSVPKKLIDVYLQRRSAKGWIRYVQRQALGQLVYQLGTKVDDTTGDTSIRPVRGIPLKALKAVAGDKDKGIGKFLNWYSKWTYSDFENRHNLLWRKVSHFRDSSDYYGFHGKEGLNHMLLLTPELLALEAKPLDILDANIKNAKSKAAQKELEAIRQEVLKNAKTKGSDEELVKSYGKLADRLEAISSPDAKAMREYHEVMKAIHAEQERLVAARKAGKPEQQKLNADMVKDILEARGKLNSKAAERLKAVKQIEEEMARDFCYVRINGLYEDPNLERIRLLADRAADDVLAKNKISARTAKDREQAIHDNRVEIVKALNRKIEEISHKDSALAKIARSGSSAFLDMAMPEEYDSKNQAKFLGIAAPDAKKYKETVRMEINKSTLPQLEREVNAQGEFVKKGVVSRYVEALEGLNQALGGTGKIAPTLGMDPAGAIAGYQLKQICAALGNPKELKDLSSIDNFLNFEAAMARSAKTRGLDGTVEGLSRMISEQRDNKEAMQKIAKALEIKGVTDADTILQRLRQVIDNRKSIIERLFEMQKADMTGYKFIAEKVGLTNASPPGEIVERLHMLEPSLEKFGLRPKKWFGRLKDTREFEEVCSLLHVNKDQLKHSSVSEEVFIRVMEKTNNQLGAWGGRVLSTGKLLSGDFGAWLKNDFQGEVDDFRKNAGLEQALEYPANRKSLLFNQYKGLQGLHTETLLYTSRRLNDLMDSAISKGLSSLSKGYNITSNVSGNMLGSFGNIFTHNLQAFAAERTLYQNLVSESGKVYDKKFVSEATRIALGKKEGYVPTNAEIAAHLKIMQSKGFDATAYYQLMERGLLFRDAKRGVPYVISTEVESGAVPLMEFDTKVLQKQGKGLIIGKDEKDRDYGALLSRVNVSDFAGEVKGIVAVRNINEGKEGKGEEWKRVDPGKMHEVQTLMANAKFDPGMRGTTAGMLAGITSGGEHGKPLLKFLHGADYYENHLGKGGQFYQKVGYQVGQFAYGVFMDNVEHLRTWYAAQARARHAMMTIEKMSGNWMVSQNELLRAADFIKKHGLTLQDDIANLDNAEKEKLASKLDEMVRTLEDKDKKAAWMRKNYAKMDEETASHLNGAYAAKLELKALQMMHESGYLSTVGISASDYKDWVNKLKVQEREMNNAYKKAYGAGREFSKMMIGLTGSHEYGSYYGSGRNTFTMFAASFPGLTKFEYEQGFGGTTFGLTLESTAMRDSLVARANRTGAEYWETMNMNTGQGIYENSRWWATAMYEQQMNAYLGLSHFMHRALMPFASGFYRAEVGLSSVLQRTALETDFGKARFKPLTLLGLSRGANDILSAQMQEFYDASGLSTAMYALRRGGSVAMDRNGNITSNRSWYVPPLERFGTESSHVMSDTQIAFQSRIQDRVKTAKEYADPKLREDVARWVSAYEAYDYGDHSKLAELRELEKKLEPFAAKYVDESQEANKRYVAGNYFNKDGSRSRFHEIFERDFISTWRPIIPGMTDSDPYLGTTLSSHVVGYYDQAKETSRLGMTKSFRVYGYDEASNRFVAQDLFNTHRDAMREMHRLETPAMLELLKVQSNLMQYELIAPITTGFMAAVQGLSLGLIPASDWYARKRALPLSQPESLYLQNELASYGFAGGIGQLDQNLAVKHQNWDEIAAGTRQHSTWASRVADRLTLNGERMVERLRILGLQATEFERNQYEVRSQIRLGKAPSESII